MKTPLAIFITLILINIAFGGGDGHITTWNGEEYETYVDDALIEASPEWHADPNSLPFSSMEALSLTNKWMKENMQEQEWSLASIYLQKYPREGKDFWAWFLDYRNGKSVVAHVTEEGHEVRMPDRLSFVVTLNGNLIAPKKN